MASVAVTLVAAAAVSPVLFTALVTPAWAERIPPGPASAAAGSAGTVQSLTLTGPARLTTASTLTASAAVVVPNPTQGRITVTVAGRTCTSSAVVPVGRSSLSVGCAVTPTAAQIPALTGTVSISLDRVETGQVRRTTRTAQRSVALDDGADVPFAEAKARWTALATALHAEAGDTSESMYGSAYAASAVWREAQLSGWSSPATRARIEDLLATRKRGGGYGLDLPYDAYQDGSVNPASTTYTVTTAGHVGWLLVEAYKNRALPEGGLSSAVDAMLAMPRLNGGTCFAYSDAPGDAARPCVYNVSHGAAAFLVQVRELTSYRAAEIDALLLALRSKFTSGYDPATGYWAYMSGSTTAQDISHQVYTAKSVDVVDPSFHAVERMMALPWWRQPGGMTQTRAALASAMMDVAKECRYARSPAVLLAAERALRSGAASYTVLGMSAVGDEIQRTCFGGEPG